MDQLNGGAESICHHFEMNLHISYFVKFASVLLLLYFLTMLGRNRTRKIEEGKGEAPLLPPPLPTTWRMELIHSPSPIPMTGPALCRTAASAGAEIIFSCWPSASVFCTGMRAFFADVVSLLTCQSGLVMSGWLTAVVFARLAGKLPQQRMMNQRPKGNGRKNGKSRKNWKSKNNGRMELRRMEWPKVTFFLAAYVAYMMEASW